VDRPQDSVLVLANPTAGVYAAPHDGAAGYLLWARDNQIVAQMLDVEGARLTGEAKVVPGTEGVGVSLPLQRAAFSLSQEGTLLFGGAEDRFQLEWFGRNGQRTSRVGDPERYLALRISRDGSRVAMSQYDSSANRDLWTMDLDRGVPSRLTTDGGFVPIWSPDGHRIAYHDVSQMKLFTITADRSDRQLVLDSPEPVYINDWSPDGRSLLYTRASQTTVQDLWRFSFADHTQEPWLATPFNESHAQYSPDGKWIAFTSDDSGHQEIYVRRLDGKDPVRVSATGGSFARWRADGTELFYRSLDGRLMAVPVSVASDRFVPGTPIPLIEIVEPLGTYAYPYDISPDGAKVLTLRSVTGERATAPLTVLVQWDAGLRK
jgi:dipeptidyl aminopeptidase/acylaminoacyl peptidase